MSRAPVRLTIGVVSALSTAVMPVFLLGAVGVFVRADLELSSLAFGVVLSAFNGGWLLTTLAGGRLADRLGGRRTVAIGVVGSAVGLIAVALATAWWQLVVILALTGVANALVQPGASAALARGIDIGRHGLALGMKGVNAPVASLLGGLAVPLVAVPFGWRWVLVAGAATGLVYFVLTPSPLRADRVSGGSSGRAPRDRRLLALVVAAAAGNAAANFLTGFFVEWQVATGMTEGSAGLLFAVGAACGSLARVLAGARADATSGDGTRTATHLFAAGALGMAVLALDPVAPVDVVVTVVVFGAGWGWLGLLFLAVVRAAPGAPGDATGVLGVGLALGGLVGPSGLGALADLAGLSVAWGGAALLLGVAALACGSAARHSGREPVRSA